ncbi:hypothetical protein ACI2IX_17815 [Leifsonia aquatica]|uniref:hypothetical protein n=1 Tax=Leifsonia aquatica TaxID=144185 RepID=UPI00384F7C41
MKSSQSTFATVRTHWRYSSLLFLSAAFAGATTAAIPLLLNDFGYSKAAIAVFFCVNPIIAVLYNLVGMRWVAKAGYPPAVLVVTCLSVPTGTTLMTLSGGSIALLYLGSALMVTTSTIIPQVFGRLAAATNGDTQELVIASLRQLQVAGYIAGLGAFALFGSISVSPVAGAASIAAIAAVIALTTSMARSRRSESLAPAPSKALPVHSTPVAMMRWTYGLVAAVVIVGLLKSADAMRAVYFPLYAATAGFTAADISLLLIAAAIVEFAVLPLIGRGGVRLGSFRMIAIVSVLGSLSFLTLILAEARPLVYASQMLFALFTAGFQSIGLAMLARLLPGGAGQGAAVFQAVLQFGAILGVTLPLLVPGYSGSIFAVALLACLLAAMISALLARSQNRSQNPDRFTAKD